jgi:hypothetical protein
MRRGEPLGGKAWLTVAGALVVLVGLSLRWYTASVADIQVADGTFTGWQALDVLDVYLVAVAIAAVLVMANPFGRGGIPPAARTAVTLAAAAGLTATIYRALSAPGGIVPGFVVESSVGPGPLVAAGGLVLLLAGTRFPASSSAAA